MMSAATLADALGRSRKEGAGWCCLCPAHDDHDPSLSIIEKNGRLLLKCRAGCDQDAVIEALKTRDLWPEHDSEPHLERVYDYRDENGELRYQVVRRPPNGTKKPFLQRRPNGAGWIWNMEGVEPLPYRLPELIEATNSIVFIAEGEKDCDNLAELGFVATTNHGGAGKWRSSICCWFAGCDVVILPDNDEPGRRHAADVARQLSGIAASVRILELPGLPLKGDVSDWIDAGGSGEHLLALAEMTLFYDPPAQPVPQRRFPPVWFDDIELTTTPRCIIEDLIPHDSLVVVWGPPKCGKSFWVFDMVMHVALGWEYRGHQVEQGTVLYIAAEGELGIRARAHAFRQARMAEAAEQTPFALLTTRLDLVEDIDELVSDLKAALPEERCSVVVIDTLNRTIHGSESKDDDMGAYRDAADRLRVELHCAVIIIHHCGVDGTRPRGHTGLTGAADAQLSVKKDVDNSILVTLELMKDGPDGSMMRGRLEVVEVGVDRNGKPVTSCVIEHLDAPTPGEQRDRRRKLSTAQALALKLLNEAINRGGEAPLRISDRIPDGRLCVTEELWRKYCYEGGISGGETYEAKRAAFTRAAEALIDGGHVGKWGEWVWIPCPPTP
jgi:hypothetical protein